MTEEEAKTKWCPFAQVLGTLTKPSPDGTQEVVTASGPHNRGYSMGGALHNCMCIGSACMAWRWNDDPNPEYERQQTSLMSYGFPRPPMTIKSETEGRCGVAGHL